MILSGFFQGTVDFGGGPVTSGGGGQNTFVVKYSPSGTYQWVMPAVGSSLNMGQDVATDRSGNVGVTGKFLGTEDFGLGSMTSAGGYDIFLLKLRP
jgi:hypothetical protein